MGSSGLEIAGGTASGNLVQGNSIGTNPTAPRRSRMEQRRYLHQQRAEQHDRWYGGRCRQPDLRQRRSWASSFSASSPRERDPGQHDRPDATGRLPLPNRLGGIFVNTNPCQPDRWNGSWPGQSGSEYSHLRPARTRRSGVDVLSGRQASEPPGEGRPDANQSCRSVASSFRPLRPHPSPLVPIGGEEAIPAPGLIRASPVTSSPARVRSHDGVMRSKLSTWLALTDR